jgi:lysine 2,3-aminomutase
MSSSSRPPTLRTPAELACEGLIRAEQIAALEGVTARYAVSITPAIAELVDRTDPNDPIARQFVPRAEELQAHAAETADPIGDAVHEKVPGLIHRYPDRVLLKLVSACAVYCRFCFRRENVGPQHGTALAGADFERALDYIRSHEEIWEVILSGGDPLILSPRRLRDVTRQLSTLPHVKVLRWHTRVPAVAPEHVTAAMTSALKSPTQAVYVALHANHPRELTPAAREACARIVDAGIPMVSQTVLLKGVNDDPGTLAALMRAFVEARVKPYYLHHADLAPGTGHFRTTIRDGQNLMRALRGRVSGLCQPTYVLDIPGGHGKVPIGPVYASQRDEGEYELMDPAESRHGYCDCTAPPRGPSDP